MLISIKLQKTYLQFVNILIDKKIIVYAQVLMFLIINWTNIMPNMKPIVVNMIIWTLGKY